MAHVLPVLQIVDDAAALHAAAAFHGGVADGNGKLQRQRDLQAQVEAKQLERYRRWELVRREGGPEWHSARGGTCRRRWRPSSWSGTAAGSW